MKARHFLAWAMGLALMASCQQNGYKIEGSGDALVDGDTLYLTADMNDMVPSDSVVVKNGKFTITGETDTTYMCLLYSPTNPNVVIPFFVERGTIKLEFPKDDEARVSGTLCNQEWQTVLDTTLVLTKRVNELSLQMFKDENNMELQARNQQEMVELNKRFSQFIFNTGKKNINNEFGYHIVNYYSEGVLDNKQIKELIQMMPEAMRQRENIKKMKERYKTIQDTSEGTQISDFRIADINGKELSLLEEVKKNKLTAIDFWASWCGPCRRVMPQVVTVYKKYHDKGLGIIGISLDEDKEAWKEAVSELGIEWIQMSDLKGWNNAIAMAFNIRAIPHMMVLDESGRIVSYNVEPAELDELCAQKLQ